MIEKRLDHAFLLTKEAQALSFERFANAFLVDDYPELAAMGGKKDGAIDARLVCDESGKPLLVVQSCVSPADKARGKILNTLKGLSRRQLPSTLIYCTSNKIGLALDGTKRELRQAHNLILEICDSVWFLQRVNTSENRRHISEAYSQEVLNPILSNIQPNIIYRGILNDEQQRIALTYFEAQNVDCQSDRNLTKSVFDSLIAYVMRDSNPPERIYSLEEIIYGICSLLPSSHSTRIKQIVPGRIDALINKDLIKFHSKENKYALAFLYRDELKNKLKLLADNEIHVRSKISLCIKEVTSESEIDYEYNVDQLLGFIHNCLIWFMDFQGKRFVDPYSVVVNIMNAESLVNEYLKSTTGKEWLRELSEEIIYDIAPRAIFKFVNLDDPEIHSYLRRKADVFIVESFLQMSPDVQECCKQLLGQDHFYLDTTIIVRCISESNLPKERQHLIAALESARTIGIKLKTFRSCIQELVTHLKGPVLLEWINNFKGQPFEQTEQLMDCEPTLLRVFFDMERSGRMSVEHCVENIVGRSNEEENAIEYLSNEFGIVTEDQCVGTSSIALSEWQQVFGIWLDSKHKKPDMSEEKFQLLVRNDVNSYCSVLEMRRSTETSGQNYGQKIWWLTTDQVVWRIPRGLNKEKEHQFQVAMSLDYLCNYIATLTKAVTHSTRDDISPFACLFDVGEFVPRELRKIVAENWISEGVPKYIKERKIRDEVQKLKTNRPTGDLIRLEKIETMPDELLEPYKKEDTQ